MKILYVITKGTWGGAQRYVYDLATSVQQNHDVAVAFGTPGLLKEKLAQKNIRTIEISSLGRDINPLLDIHSFFALLRIFRKEKPDVVHVNSSKIGGMGALAARLVGIKNIVFTAHGWAFNEDRSTLSRYLIMFLSWVTIMLSHKVIVLGSRELRQALAMPITSNVKIFKIYNGITEPAYLPQEAARNFILSKTGISLSAEQKNLPWILSLGELHKNKGYKYALKAFSKLSTQALYFIIGEGEERESLEHFIIENNLQSKVFLVGAIPEAATYLKAADVFLLASIKEGLPYVLLEAGFAALPVVATDVGAISELIHPETGSIVPARNPEAITAAVENFLVHPDTAQSAGSQLHEYVAAHYTLTTTVDNTLALYRRNTI
jgi:glycosyltransferase involved in cell wall biosynthesis